MKILDLSDFINESKGARLVNRNPDRFNSDPLKTKGKNTILSKHIQKRFKLTEEKMKMFCSSAEVCATEVFDSDYIQERYGSLPMLYPDGCGDYFRFDPYVEMYDDDLEITGIPSIGFKCRVLMDIGGVVFPEGMSLIGTVNNAIRNRFEYQMGLELSDENFDDDEDRLLGLGAFSEDKPGMFYVNPNGLEFFKKEINMHNNGDYSNYDYDIHMEAYKNSSYRNIVIALDVSPTLNTFDVPNAVYQNNITNEELGRYGRELGECVANAYIDVFTRISDEYADVLR